MHFDFTLLQHKNTLQKVGKIRAKTCETTFFLTISDWLPSEMWNGKSAFAKCDLIAVSCCIASLPSLDTMTITINICFRRQSLIPKNWATFVSCPIAFAVRNGIKNSPSLCRNFRLSYYRHLIRSFDSSPIFDSCHTSRVSTLIKWY